MASETKNIQRTSPDQPAKAEVQQQAQPLPVLPVRAVGLTDRVPVPPGAPSAVPSAIDEPPVAMASTTAPAPAVTAFNALPPAPAVGREAPPSPPPPPRTSVSRTLVEAPESPE